MGGTGQARVCCPPHPMFHDRRGQHIQQCGFHLQCTGSAELWATHVMWASPFSGLH